MLVVDEINTSLFPPRDGFEAWKQHLAKHIALDPAQAKIIGAGFFRAKRQLFKVGGLSFGRFAVTPHSYYQAGSAGSPVIPENCFQINLPLKGLAVEAIDERVLQYMPGNLYIIDFDQPRTMRFPRRFESVSVYLSKDKFQDIFPLDHRFNTIECSAENGTGAILADIMRSIESQLENLQNDSMIVGKIADLFLSALAALLYSLPRFWETRSSKLEVYHKSRIKSHVKENLRRNLNVDLIGEAVNLSPSYIHRLFSKERLPLMKWVMEERLDRCRQDLESKLLANRSIKEIAYSWGFNDQTHFSHAFRSRFGMSPSDHRKKWLPQGAEETVQESSIQS